MARSLKFSSQGEMFSSTNLATLALEYFKIPSSTRVGFTPRDVLDHLATGGLCLVPYDKDKNNQPCCAGGAKAHWAVIAGIVIPLRERPGFVVDDRFRRLDLEKDVRVRHLQPAETKEYDLTEEELQGAFVIALHGNSRHQALWSLQSLLER